MSRHQHEKAEKLGQAGISAVSNAMANLEGVGKNAMDAAADSLETVKDQASELYQQGQKKIAEVSEKISREVRARPVQSILAVGGLFLVLGLLFGFLKRR